MRRLCSHWFCIGTVLLVLLVGGSAIAQDDPWAALRSGGHAVLLRHAIAPGTGDPPDFDLRRCATQRNLSAVGREQAARIGARFLANGIAAAKVYSSQWCRSLETARLLDLGPVNELPALNSFFGRPDAREAQTDALRRWLARQPSEDLPVLVTHQVNITALTGVYPASGEMVVIRWTDAGEPEVVGTIETD